MSEAEITLSRLKEEGDKEKRREELSDSLWLLAGLLVPILLWWLGW